MRRLCACALLVAIASAAPAGDSFTLGGCPCTGSCERTIDSPYIAWCATAKPPSWDSNSSDPTCATAVFSASRNAYWENCLQNLTGVETTTVLTTFSEMWTYITASAVVASAAAYCLMGCAASLLTDPRSTLWWLPELAAVIGAVQGLLVGGVLSVLVSLVYLTMPYAIDRNVAVALGIAVATLISYSALGHYSPKRAQAHGSD
jgi:hypothetical protein